VGGGEAGAFYVRQLVRAERAGRLRMDAIVVIDRARDCRVAALVSGRVRLEVAEWSSWLDANLSGADPADELVPYHWAPHLLVGWLRREAERAGALAERRPLPAPRGTPFERTTREGDSALSYATWTCPPTCIEPALCPHTRGPKSWSLAGELATPAAAPLDAALVLPSLHLVYGVATIPVSAIHAARRTLLDGLALGERRYLVATASHCHGLATALRVVPGS
jgi:hypothetical protein